MQTIPETEVNDAQQTEPVPATSPAEAPPAVDEPPPSVETQLRAELAATEEKLRACATAYRQVIADVERERERGRAERERQLDRERMGIARGLLHVLDNLDRSLLSAPTEGPGATLTTGVRMVRSQFLESLKEMGVERMDVLGRTFDVGLHEAAGVIPPSETCPDKHVAFEAAAGYLFKGQLLRAAKVVVAQAPEDA
jgi:molecular chaperone GrpE